MGCYLGASMQNKEWLLYNGREQFLYILKQENVTQTDETELKMVTKSKFFALIDSWNSLPFLNAPMMAMLKKKLGILLKWAEGLLNILNKNYIQLKQINQFSKREMLISWHYF